MLPYIDVLIVKHVYTSPEGYHKRTVSTAKQWLGLFYLIYLRTVQAN